MPIDVTGHYEVGIQAKCLGEDCFNTLHYTCGAGTGTLGGFLSAFRTLWRAQIIPLVTEQYVVQNYVVRQFGAVVWKSAVIPPVIPPAWPNVTPLIRYSDNAVLAGDPVLDAGDVTTTEMASLMAVGCYKACHASTEVDFTVLPYGKLLKGFIRFGGIPEASSDDGDGNSLNAGAEAAWQSAANALRAPVLDSNNFSMEVWSLFEDRVPRVAAGLPMMARATVSSLAIASVLTSQVTRKPRRGQ